MNKGYITNFLAAVIFCLGYFFKIPYLLAMGSYALSGAITNQLAIHMLFEKVPGFYGSGVIQLRFEEFKQAIKSLMMREFFNEAQLKQLLSTETKHFIDDLDWTHLLKQLDFSAVFEKLVQSILSSEQGAMLNMIGGESLLMSFKEKFIATLQNCLQDADELESLKASLHAQLQQKNWIDTQLIERLIDARLQVLTPQAVKKMVAAIIYQHLDWLVVWGGVLGALIGLASYGASIT